MIDAGWLGSPVDVATFFVVLVGFAHGIRPDLDALAAAVVALAREEDGVDGDRVAADLEVSNRDVRQYQHPVTDGGERGDD
ncbi:hypothetical protein [Halosegnis longus]|uniref:hypothetical protein n=1 Tax=Halosegnis longus TaxID=2216012 RepID=UPI0011CDF943